MVPAHSAVDTQNWTAQKLKTNPLVVFEKKLKPRKPQVIQMAVKRSIAR